mgnify:CR=1 FL=1
MDGKKGCYGIGGFNSNCVIGGQGKVETTTFDGNDAHAEVIEKLTGLTFLGDSTDDYSHEKQCHMTSKMTKRRVILAKTY